MKGVIVIKSKKTNKRPSGVTVTPVPILMTNIDYKTINRHIYFEKGIGTFIKLNGKKVKVVVKIPKPKGGI